MHTLETLNIESSVGAARRLFRPTLEAAQRKGYERILTYIRAVNPSALAIYSNQGFRIAGTALRQERVRGRYIDEVVVERFLQERLENGGASLHRYPITRYGFGLAK